MEWFKVEDKLPDDANMDEPCNIYYLVRIEGYSTDKAMFSHGKWYNSYISEIIKPVTHWSKIENL